ncbi:MAG: hypothetical protein AAFP76_05165 [Bacteroidota bacterium]
MKKLLILSVFSILSLTTLAQEALKKDLFTADVVMKYREKIDLTEKQTMAIKKIHKALSSDFNSAKWDLDAAMLKLNQMLEETAVDEPKALAQMKRVTDLEEQLKMKKLTMLIKIKNELNASQQTKLKELRTDKDFSPIKLITDINDNHKIKFQVKGSTTNKDKPLYIIKTAQGEKEVTGAYFEKLKPKNIQSVSVLKDKPAISRYGDKGKNGVIVIEMKQKK